jgi:hypothetical protein
VPEGNSVFITVSASQAPVQPLTVTYSISGKARLGSDFTIPANPGVIVIPAGQTSAGVIFQAISDGLAEKKEAVKLKLNTGPGYKLPKGAAGKSVNIKITSATTRR